VQVISKLFGYRIARDFHNGKLDLLVTAINGEFLVNLPETTTFIKDFLPKAKRILALVDLLAVDRRPTTLALDIPDLQWAGHATL